MTKKINTKFSGSARLLGYIPPWVIDGNILPIKFRDRYLVEATTPRNAKQDIVANLSCLFILIFL